MCDALKLGPYWRFCNRRGHPQPPCCSLLTLLLRTVLISLQGAEASRASRPRPRWPSRAPNITASLTSVLFEDLAALSSLI